MEEPSFNEPHTYYLEPRNLVLVNGMENLPKHQLSSVCRVPFWLAVI
jgi:hypothetical protein